MRWVLVCVVFLATLAGCNALGADQPETVSPTVTPAPVPSPTTAEPTITPVAPGVATTGVADLDELVDGHVRAARNESWVWTENSTVTEARGNVTATTTNEQTVTFVDERTYLHEAGVVSFRRGSALQFYQDYRQYANGQMYYESWYSAERQTVVAHREPVTPAGRTFEGFAASAVRHYVPTESTTVSRVDVGDRPHFALVGTRSRAPNYGSVDTYRARAVVREDGFVRRLNVTYAFETADRRVEGRYTFTYRQVGNATVEQPDWVEAARGDADT